MMRLLALFAALAAVEGRYTPMADLCPFGYGCGGGGSISPGTKSQVANILKGILSNLTKHKGYFNQLNSELSKKLTPDLKEYLGNMGAANLEDAVNVAVQDAAAPDVKKHVTMALTSVVWKNHKA